MAREVGTIGLERVLLTVAELGSGDEGRDEPLLGRGHDDMGRDRRNEGRDGEGGGESELHFEIWARKYPVNYVQLAFCFFFLDIVYQIEVATNRIFYRGKKLSWIRTVKCIILRIMSGTTAAGV